MSKRGIIGLAFIGVFICLFLSFSVSALSNTATVTQSVGVGGAIHVFIDSTSYGGYVYFFKESDKTSPLVVLDLGCSDARCTQAKEFDYILGTNFAPGKFILAVYFNDKNGWEYYSFEATAAVFRKPISTVIYGDVSNDGFVNMIDLNLMVDMLLARIPAPTPGTDAFIAADLNVDNSFGMADLNVLIDFLLGRISSLPHSSAPIQAVCNLNGVCDAGLGEDTGNCPQDCTSTPVQLVDVETPVASSSCTSDSDNGADFSSLGDTVDSSGKTTWDACSNANTLIEQKCSNGQRIEVTHTCPNGCFDGVCEPAPLNCTDSDADESNEGLNYNQFGTVTDWTEEPQDDYCDGDTLVEGFCNEFDEYDSTDYACPFGCSQEEGKCNPQPNCIDSDDNGLNGGIDYETRGTVTDRFDAAYSDECIDSSSDVLIEKTCGDNFEVQETQYECPFGCSNGACLTTPQTVLAAAQSTCTDSDGGANYFKKGVCKDIGGDYNDSCQTGTASGYLQDNMFLSETFCTGEGYCEAEVHRCEQGCNNGSCIYSECQGNELVVKDDSGRELSRTDCSVGWSGDGPRVVCLQGADSEGKPKAACGLDQSGTYCEGGESSGSMVTYDKFGVEVPGARTSCPAGQGCCGNIGANGRSGSCGPPPRHCYPGSEVNLPFHYFDCDNVYQGDTGSQGYLDCKAAEAERQNQIYWVSNGGSCKVDPRAPEEVYAIPCPNGCSDTDVSLCSAPAEEPITYSVVPLKFTTLDGGDYADAADSGSSSITGNAISSSVADKWGGAGKRIPGEIYFGADPQMYKDRKIADYLDSNFYSNANEERIVADGDDLVCQTDIALSKTSGLKNYVNIKVEASVYYTIISYTPAEGVKTTRTPDYNGLKTVQCELKTQGTPTLNGAGSFDVYRCKFNDANGYEAERLLGKSLRGSKIYCQMSVAATGEQQVGTTDTGEPIYFTASLLTDINGQAMSIVVSSAPVVVAKYNFYFTTDKRKSLSETLAGWGDMRGTIDAVGTILPQLKFDPKRENYFDSVVKNIYLSDSNVNYDAGPLGSGSSSYFTEAGLSSKLIGQINWLSKNRFDSVKDTIVYISPDSVAGYNNAYKKKEVGFYTPDNSIVLNRLGSSDEVQPFIDQFNNRVGSFCPNSADPNYRANGPIDLFPILKEYTCKSLELQQKAFGDFKTQSKIKWDDAVAKYKQALDNVLYFGYLGDSMDWEEVGLAFESRASALSGTVDNLIYLKQFASDEDVQNFKSYLDVEGDTILEKTKDYIKANYKLEEQGESKFNAGGGWMVAINQGERATKGQILAAQKNEELLLALMGDSNLRLAESLQSEIKQEKEMRALLTTHYYPFAMTFEVSDLASTSAQVRRSATYTLLNENAAGYGVYSVTDLMKKNWVAEIDSDGGLHDLKLKVDWRSAVLERQYSLTDTSKNYLEHDGDRTGIFLLGDGIYAKRPEGNLRIGYINNNNNIIQIDRSASDKGYIIPEASGSEYLMGADLTFLDGAQIINNIIYLSNNEWTSANYNEGLSSFEVKVPWANGPIFSKAQFKEDQKSVEAWQIGQLFKQKYANYALAASASGYNPAVTGSFGILNEIRFHTAVVNANGVTADTFSALEASNKLNKYKKKIVELSKTILAGEKARSFAVAWDRPKSDSQIEAEIEAENLQAKIAKLTEINYGFAGNVNVDQKLRAEIVASNIEAQIDYQASRVQEKMADINDVKSHPSHIFNLGIARAARYLGEGDDGDRKMISSEIASADKVRAALMSYSYSGYAGLSTKEKDLLKAYGVTDTTGASVGSPRNLWAGTQNTFGSYWGDWTNSLVTVGLPLELLTMYSTGGAMRAIKVAQAGEAAAGKLTLSNLGLYGKAALKGIANPSFKVEAAAFRGAGTAAISEAGAIRTGSYLDVINGLRPTIGTIASESIQFMAISKTLRGGMMVFLDGTASALTGEGKGIFSGELNGVWLQEASRTILGEAFNLPGELLHTMGMFATMRMVSPIMQNAPALEAFATENLALSGYGITAEIGKAAVTGADLDLNKVAGDVIGSNLLFTVGMKGFHDAKAYDAKKEVQRMKNEIQKLKETAGGRTELSVVENMVSDLESATNKQAGAGLAMRNGMDAIALKALEARIKALEAKKGDPAAEVELEAQRENKLMLEKNLNFKIILARLELINKDIRKALDAGDKSLAQKKIVEALGEKEVLFREMEANIELYESYALAALHVERLKLEMNKNELDLVAKREQLAKATAESLKNSLASEIKALERALDLRQTIVVEGEKELANTNREFLERTYGKKYMELLDDLEKLWAKEVGKFDPAKQKEIEDRIKALQEERTAAEKAAADKKAADIRASEDEQARVLLNSVVSPERASQILADPVVKQVLENKRDMFIEALGNPRVCLRAEGFADYMSNHPEHTDTAAAIEGFKKSLGTRRVYRGVVMTPDEAFAVQTQLGLLERQTRLAISSGEITPEMLRDPARLASILESRNTQLDSIADFANKLKNHVVPPEGGNPLADPFQSSADSVDVAVSISVNALKPGDFVYVFTFDVPVFDTVPMTTAEIAGRKYSYVQYGTGTLRRPYAEAPGTERIVIGNVDKTNLVGEPLRLTKNEAEGVVTKKRNELAQQINRELTTYINSDAFQNLRTKYAKLKLLKQDPKIIEWLASLPADTAAEIRKKMSDILSDASSPDSLIESAAETNVQQIGQIKKSTWDMKNDWREVYLSEPNAVKLSQRIDELVSEIEGRRALSEKYAVPVQAAPRAEAVAAPKEKAKQIPVESVEKELSDLENRAPLELSNAEGAFATDAVSGAERKAAAERAVKATPGTSDYNNAIAALERLAKLDRYGASVLPMFESTLLKGEYASGYFLYEFSISRDMMKEINTGQGGSWLKGTASIKAQQEKLIQFAKDNGLEVSSLQKTGFLAIPKAKMTPTLKANIEALRVSMENAVKTKSGKPQASVRMGSAEISPGQSFKQAMLYTRRSLLYNEFYAKTNAEYLGYEQKVMDWYAELYLEGKAKANDIFRGYDKSLLQRYAELEKLKAGDPRGYAESLAELAQIEFEDATFNSRESVKNHMSDPVMGIRGGDMVAEVDGRKVGERNSNDILELTKKLESGEITESQLAEQAGELVDGEIKSVNLAVWRLHNTAVDNIRYVSDKTMGEFDTIAQKAGYGEVRDLAGLKSFLKWEFANKGRFRGGDELFFVVRKEVLFFNPDFELLIKNQVSKCDGCGYPVRIGSKIVGDKQTFLEAVAKADDAIKKSKIAGDQTVRFDKADAVSFPEDPLRYIPDRQPDVVSKLIQKLQTGDAKMKVEAIRDLQTENDPSATPNLIDALSDSSDLVKIAAADALGAFKSAEAAAKLQEVVNTNNNVFVAEAAHNALLNIAPEAAPEAVTPAELYKRWGSQAELSLPVTMQHLASLNPEKTVYNENGEPTAVKVKPEDTLVLERYLRGLDDQTTLNSFRTQSYGQSFGLFVKGGDLQAAKQAFESPTGRGMAAIPANILPQTWNSGSGTNLGLSCSSFEGQVKNVEYSQPGKYNFKLIIKVPANRLVYLQLVNNQVVFPEGFDVNRPDIAKFGFIEPRGDEAEVTFLYEIPKEYIKQVKIAPLKPVEVGASAPSGTALISLVFGKLLVSAFLLVAVKNEMKNRKGMAVSFSGKKGLIDCMPL